MSPSLTRSRLALHTRTVQTFGYPDVEAGAVLIWWPATAGAGTYLIAIPCHQAPVKANDKELSGLLTMPVDDAVFHALPAHFPFPPRPEMIFQHGAAIAGTAIAVTCSAATNKCTAAAHGLTDGQPVLVAATLLPEDLEADTTYYVRDAAANDFKLAATRGATALDLATAGTAVTVAPLIPDPATVLKYRLTTVSGGSGLHYRLSSQRH